MGALGAACAPFFVLGPFSAINTDLVSTGTAHGGECDYD